jgi:short-chain fatty acids transporter
MNIALAFSGLFRKFLPSPFTIAIFLSALTFILAIAHVMPSKTSITESIAEVANYWYLGFWDAPMMVFTIQMILILVLGHALAISKPVANLLGMLSEKCTTTSKAAAIVCFFSLIASFFNWGLGLIFGAIFARNVAEKAMQKNIAVNYPLIGAAGYSGLMVWHGGLSGSAPIKVAEKGHFLEEKLGLILQTETILSAMNITTSIVLLISLPLLFYWLGLKAPAKVPALITAPLKKYNSLEPEGAEKIDNSRTFSKLLGGLIILYLAYLLLFNAIPDVATINPNTINLLFIGFGLILHTNIKSFLEAIDIAITNASGILIQFPFYFGIMGIMKSSGLTLELSQFFISISNEITFPFLTMISAGIVNIFIPSGGGQWAVQGPIIAEAASQLNIPPAKAVMALAYGDQLTNMLQPFWALPLLGITGLNAKEIIPYSIMVMALGFLIFSSALFIF